MLKDALIIYSKHDLGAGSTDVGVVGGGGSFDLARLRGTDASSLLLRRLLAGASSSGDVDIVPWSWKTKREDGRGQGRGWRRRRRATERNPSQEKGQGGVRSVGPPTHRETAQRAAQERFALCTINYSSCVLELFCWFSQLQNRVGRAKHTRYSEAS